ncbi:bis-aminopropyl spermidine synthase family protein [Nocardiopsis composta]|uniref:N(4)-bis(aminopropyl)spermidine synthase C-terminal domain-containing protein n=1 Tax=Nocardiopsis composta TaxID=157465 RepID=A0A7W8QTE0_9ACTN|nr:bis-aminopropyl spermidine synthase family protein [Nocardiopsis composta]MBB5435854.1 hypothetical protein [Nocardiopsis composta]
MSDLPSDLCELLDGQGADAALTHRVLGALADGEPWSARELVRATAVPHRLVAAALDALGDGLERRGGGPEERVRLVRPGDYAGFRGSAGGPPADPGEAAVRHPRAAEELRRLVAEAPPSRTELDHVAATPGTALRRGAYLADRFAMPGRRLLCVGDHDLTSLAALLVCPEAEAVVVDVDERMLEYIDGAAARLGLAVRCHFADLRAGLPAPVAGWGDLVFTDPPYTPEGVELFVRRGLEGMADPRRGRVLVAYGASGTTPGLVARTQARLARLDLLFEAVLPDFNRYLGAEAIGAASDLYVLRPLSRTVPGGAAEQARIYSQGGNAKEAAGGGRAAGAAELLDGGTAVGDWPSAALPEGARRVRLATWLASPVPAEDPVLLLTGGWEALLGRALLAGTAPRVRAVVPSSAPEVRDAAGQRALRALLEPRFRVRFLKGVPGPRETVVEACAAPPPAGAPAADRLLAYCQERAHGPLPRTLREGLIAVTGQDGAPVNKRTARSLVAEWAPWAPHHSLLDLPGHRFADLRAAAEGMTAAAAAEHSAQG